MKIKQLMLAPVALGMIAPVATQAADLNLSSINQYSSAEQVTSVTQFSDVKPTDWAYQALSNLVDRYGCVAGYPNGTFSGGKAMTRFEAAALLNACLDRVTETTDELKKLLAEFDAELTVITARVDGLENKVGRLQAQQFSTTTKLAGQANMILGGIPGYTYGTGKDKKKAGNTAFNYDIRINFDTSYTGQDLLRTRLRTGNFSKYPFAGSQTPFKLEKAEDWNDAVQLDRLYYSFPVGKNKNTKMFVGALIRNTEMAWLASAYKDDVLDVFSTVGTTGVYNKATGQGIGLQWKQNVAKGKPAWIFNANYVVSGKCADSKGINGIQGCDGDYGTTGKNGQAGASSGSGVFNSESGINVMTQVGYKANNWGAVVGYRYGSTGTFMRDGNGPASNIMLGNQSSNSVAFNTYWQPLKTGWIPSVSAGYGYNFISGDSTTTKNVTTGAISSKSWMVGFQWDDAFIKGNAAGIALAQPSYGACSGSQCNPFLVEWFYRFQATDNISITPTLFYGTGIANSPSSVSSTGSTFNGLGGVIQTTFKF